MDQLPTELPAITANTLTRRDDLAREVRRHGCAAAIEDETLGISAMAAPVMGHNDEFIGTVALVATVQNIAREVPAGQVQALKKAALRASWNLGFKGTF